MTDPKASGGLLGPERGIGGDQVRQVLASADLRDLTGVVQRPVRVRAQVDQEAPLDEPAHHERRHVRLLADHVRGAERIGDPVGRRAAGDRRGGHRGPQQRPGTTYNNFLPNAQGVIIGEQQNVTQNNTAGIDSSAFVQLAGYVGQISSTLGMPEADRVELERVAQELHDEATSANPEPGRMRQFTTRVKAMLVDARATAAAQVGIQAEQALGTLVSSATEQPGAPGGQ
ncbi:hypothetical protein [Streptomyces coelicoflavus]|uniref:hypothetical protein n=1 Tax=Streptomyces coelicoflavus TaxID=285562 RepID=UPI003A866FF2